MIPHCLLDRHSCRRCIPSEKWGETPRRRDSARHPGMVTAEELCQWINERVDAKNQRVHAVTILRIFHAALQEKLSSASSANPSGAGTMKKYSPRASVLLTLSGVHTKPPAFNLEASPRSVYASVGKNTQVILAHRLHLGGRGSHAVRLRSPCGSRWKLGSEVN